LGYFWNKIKLTKENNRTTGGHSPNLVTLFVDNRCWENTKAHFWLCETSDSTNTDSEVEKKAMLARGIFRDRRLLNLISAEKKFG
jgi:hypothetical protein